MIDNGLISPTPPRRAGRKEWIGLAVLVLPCLLISMDMSVLLFGLPFISASLKPSATQQLWIMDAYGFALAGVLITMGAVGDRIGRRRLLLAGTAAFGGASAVAAYAGSADLLIASRALLGLAGATLMPSTMALIRNMFHDEKQRNSAIGLWTGGIVGGATLGPVVGGLLLDHFWWGSVFLINLPAMALLLVLGPILLPEFKMPADGRRFDYAGSVLSIAAVLPTVYGVKQLAVDGYSAGALAAVALGIALGIAFLIRQRTAADPLIDTALFGTTAFRVPVLVNALGNFVMIGFSLYNTQYLQSVAGMRPFTAALWSLAVLPAVSVGMAVTGTLTTRIRPATLIGGGFLIAAAGAAVLLLVRPGNPVAVLLIGAGAVACGMVAAQTIAGTMVMTAASAERAGSASALNETGSELGSALGMALLGSIGAAVYHHKMSGQTPAGIPADAIAQSHQTLGSAVAVADQYPGPVSRHLLGAARDAYTVGFHVAAVTGAVLLTLTGLYVMSVLRHEPPLPAAPEKEKAPKHAGQRSEEPISV
ncbi:major facilitator superfamily MFS_1 [Catenulispora acidiphila DSM 44928]|uniref:Major facilitator superfamily MFS_1 n=1 Tax=Catenulispora acidiphila (strain DSM 44928 / JCM 14897 / NBRC 102108 / NRRL B-24433 / ID139908) TaxID=479433 RepID=C7Q119_CATAD|nr:MFS transporter [Catenulispora acidiphila]ACU71694.1 major facilitator superfamily MFS_1 [Catenulispora acidiphila DSM 44928]